MSPALAGGFLTPGPLGKSHNFIFDFTFYVYKNKIALLVLKNIAFSFLRIRNMAETKIMKIQISGNIQIIFQDKKEQTLKTRKK